MEDLQKRYLILICLLLIAAGASHMLSAGSSDVNTSGIQAINSFPLLVGDWVGTEMSMDERVYEILETDLIIHRIYSNGEKQVFLSIVYYPETITGFHTPDFCLLAQGIEPEKSGKEIELSSGNESKKISMTQLKYKTGDRSELAYYFFKSGEYMGSSYILLRLSLALGKIMHRSLSGSLIRISSIIPYGDIDTVSGNLSEFLEALHPHLLELS